MKKPVLFHHFLRNPGRVGSICPSSPELCQQMIEGTGLDQAAVVVELGAGTGAITRHILDRKLPDARFIVVELDRMLCKSLAQEFPEVAVCNESAASLGNILERQSLSHADNVISSLPWANFPDRLQREILEVIATNLSHQGCFTTYAYLQGLIFPRAARFRKRLSEVFGEVETTRIIWRNLPPAVVYRCRK